jgi:hypothetical protein
MEEAEENDEGGGAELDEESNAADDEASEGDEEGEEGAGEEADSTEEDDTSEVDEDNEDADSTNGDDNGEDVMEENDDTEDDTPTTAKRAAKMVSLMDMAGMLSVERVPLDETGYLGVASTRDNRKMERFVERLASDMALTVVDPGGLKGMVPFYSGRKATQSFEALQAELLSTARVSDGWVQRDDEQAEPISIAQKTKTVRRKKRREHLLLQTGAAERHIKEHRRSAPVSLLSRAATQVPDLAVALFGSRTLVLVCAVGLLACLFALDERKRTGGGTEYEDPLALPVKHEKLPLREASSASSSK